MAGATGAGAGAGAGAARTTGDVLRTLRRGLVLRGADGDGGASWTLCTNGAPRVSIWGAGPIKGNKLTAKAPIICTILLLLAPLTWKHQRVIEAIPRHPPLICPRNCPPVPHSCPKGMAIKRQDNE